MIESLSCTPSDLPCQKDIRFQMVIMSWPVINVGLCMLMSQLHKLLMTTFTPNTRNMRTQKQERVELRMLSTGSDSRKLLNRLPASWIIQKPQFWMWDAQTADCSKLYRTWGIETCVALILRQSA